MATYHVKRGDTLSAIARRLGTSVQALVAANRISDPNKIAAGAKLVIPADASLNVPMPRPRPIAPPALQTLPPPPIAPPGSIAGQGQAFGPAGLSGASQLRPPPTVNASGTALPPPSIPGSAALSPLSLATGRAGNVPGGSGAAGLSPRTSAQSMDALMSALAQRSSSVQPGSDAASVYADVGQPPQPSAAPAIPPSLISAMQMPSAADTSGWYGMGDTPGTEPTIADLLQPMLAAGRNNGLYGSGEASGQAAVRSPQAAYLENPQGALPTHVQSAAASSNIEDRSSYAAPVTKSFEFDGKEIALNVARPDGSIMSDQEAIQNYLSGDHSNMNPRGGQVFAAGVPDTYDGTKTMANYQPLPSKFTLNPDALVQGAKDAGLVGGLPGMLPNDMIWNGALGQQGMAGKIAAGVPSEVGSFDPSSNNLSLSPETVARIDDMLGKMGPLGEFGRGSLMGTNDLISKYAKPQVAPAQSFPLPVPRPTPPAPPALPAAPPAPLPGLTSRSVQTVPVDAYGQPILTATAAETAPPFTPPADTLNSPAYWERAAANGGEAPFDGPIDWAGIGGTIGGSLNSMFGPSTPAPPAAPDAPIAPASPDIQTADNGYGYNLATGEYELKQPGQAYGLGPPQSYVPEGTLDPNKDTSQLDTPLPSAGDMEPPTQVADLGAPPSPMPYPVAPDALPVPPSALLGPDTPETAIAAIDAVAPEPSAPALAYNSPSSSTSNYTPPFISAPPSVKTATGKTMAIGSTGSAQGGARTYTLNADGSIVNDLGRVTAPPTIQMPPMTTSMDTSPKPALDPTKSSANGFMDFFNRTPVGHVIQAVTGKPVEGGLLKVLGVNSGNNSSSPAASSSSSQSAFGPNPAATYWDPKSGTYVTPYA